MYFRAGVVILAATAVVFVATPAEALPGLVLVRSTSLGTPDRLYFAEAACPAGTQLTGGGARGSDGTLRVSVARPSADGNALWWAGALGNGNPSTTITAYGICATGMSGYQIVTAEHLPPVGSLMAAATATCPAGKRVIGAGASNAGQPGYVVEGVRISSDLTSVFARTLRGPTATSDTAPYAVAFAICIDPVPGQQRVMATTATSTGTVKSISVRCPSGTRLHGLGGMVSGGSGRVGLQALYPTTTFTGSPVGTSVTARVLAGTSYQGAWRAEAYGVCAQ